MQNLLFICSRNQIRSVTAAKIYARTPNLAVRSAGTASSARHRVNAADVEWAHLVFAFEHRHKVQLQQRFGELLAGRQLIVLGIPDEYKLMEDDLVEEIQAQVGPHLTGSQNSNFR